MVNFRRVVNFYFFRNMRITFATVVYLIWKIRNCIIFQEKFADINKIIDEGFRRLLSLCGITDGEIDKSD